MIKGILFVITLNLSAFTVQAGEVLTVAVASSLYPVAQQQARVFEKEHAVTLRLVSGSTGRLYNQIMQGAPFDAFIAADQQRPALLSKQGKVISHMQIGEAYLAAKAGGNVLADPALLLDSAIRHIVIANPEVAPFGKVSKQALKSRGLWKQLKHKIIYAQNAMQASMMVNKGVVDAGFVPITSKQSSIASIEYHGVILVDRPMLVQWLEHMAALNSSSGQDQLEPNQPDLQLVRRNL